MSKELLTLLKAGLVLFSGVLVFLIVEAGDIVEARPKFSSVKDRQAFKGAVLSCLRSVSDECLGRLFKIPLEVIFSDIDNISEGSKCVFSRTGHLESLSILKSCLKKGALDAAIKDCLTGEIMEINSEPHSGFGKRYLCGYELAGGSLKIKEVVALP